MKIRTLVVDDEALSRKLIRRLLAGLPEFQVIGECANGRSALDFMAEDMPDLILLDVQMPELNGFEVLSRMDPAKLPVVIFITAYDSFALKAFNAHALDYLLKPFDEDRFYDALRRAKTYTMGREDHSAKDRLRSLVDNLPGPAKYISRLLVKDGSSVSFFKVEEIDWFGANGNYIGLHVGKREYLLRGRLSELEKKLAPDRFFRIHRSAIVNLDQVKEFVPLFKGEGAVTLKSGERLSASRSCSQRLMELLGAEL